MANDRSLGARLLAPQQRVSLDVLPSLWFHTLVVVRCRGGRALSGQPKVIGKLRGAFGEQLKASASAEALAGRPCPWRPPCALDVLFRPQARITPALEVPKPYVLATLADGEDLVVRLTLFGLATEWTEAAVEALVRACRTLDYRGRQIEVIDREFWSEERVAAPTAAAAAVLAFETPLDIRERRRNDGHELASVRGETAERAWEGDGEAAFDFVRFIATLGNRVSGLARWQDVAVDGDFRALKEQAAAVAVQVQPQPVQRWVRFSGRQERSIPMGGRLQVVLLEGGLGPLLPLLAIGETCHAGSHATLGLGRYRISLPREGVGSLHG